MVRRARFALPLLVFLPAILAAQDPAVPKPPHRPPEVTDSAIAAGDSLFHGIAGCSGCHGPRGIGTDSGAPIAQGIWMHGPDTYAGILGRILHGVPKQFSTRGIAMPMRGWADMSDAQAKAIAAYVWEISHTFPQEPGH